jgi:hypothetical protein
VNISSSAPGYGTSLSFNATAGQNVGLGLVGLTFGGNSAPYGLPLNVYAPDGSTVVMSNICYQGSPGGDCSASASNLPMTGTYLIQLKNDNNPAITGGTFTLSKDSTGTLISGSPFSLNLRDGQLGRLTFAGTAGQPATISIGNMTTTPANLGVLITVLGPDGSMVGTQVDPSTSTNGGAWSLASLPTTGNYTVMAVPAFGAPATLSLTLAYQ